LKILEIQANMASKAMKKKESKERVASAARTIPEQSTAPSVVGSLNEKDEKSKKAKLPIVIWPEWTEQDINQEKWVSQFERTLNWYQ